VDFGATDGPMSDEQLKSAPGELMHLPTVLGGVVAVYNAHSVTASLNFPSKTLADIFLGRVTRWNDRALAQANPGVSLPDAEIIVVHRSDGSGTTFIWTDYLSKVNPDWAKAVGKGTAVSWPVGLGGKGNEGVAGLVKQTPNSIGYVEVGYAEANQLTYGRLENAEGEFVACTRESVTAAAAATAATMPSDFRISIANPPGKGTYPAASYTWLLLYRSQTDPAKGNAVVGFLRWMLTEGQKFVGPLGYAPLPPEVIRLEEAAIAKIEVKS
jgi:phosphate transport system substrate-binding protein